MQAIFQIFLDFFV